MRKDKPVYQLSEEQVKAIEEAMNQIRSGQVLTNEEADQEIDDLLNDDVRREWRS